MGVGGQRHTPAALTGGYPVPIVQEAGRAQDLFGWVRKISPSPGLDLRTVYSVANRYTYYATPARYLPVVYQHTVCIIIFLIR